MPLNDHDLNELEQEYSSRFVDALLEDIKSGRHVHETNWQVISVLRELVKNRHLVPQLNLEELIRGGMNMAVSFQDDHYSTRIINKDVVGQKAFDIYTKYFELWFEKYKIEKGPHVWEKNPEDNIFIQSAIPVIELAGKGPLFLLSNCMQHTWTVYSEYCKALNPNFKAPDLKRSDKLTIKDASEFKILCRLHENEHVTESRFTFFTGNKAAATPDTNVQTDLTP